MSVNQQNLPAEASQSAIQGIVRLPVPVTEAVSAWNEYQSLRKALHGPGDFQKFQVKQKNEFGQWETTEKEAPTKQWANKLARFFNVEVKVVTREKVVEGAENNIEHFTWYVTAVAIAPNGLMREGEGACSSFEKVDRYGKLPARAHHDVYTTASTRAKNRAILELVGFGEVSAEEMESETFDQSKNSMPADLPTLKKIKQIQDSLFGPEKSKEEVRKIVAHNGLELPENAREMTQGQAEDLLQLLTDIKDGLMDWPPIGEKKDDKQPAKSKASSKRTADKTADENKPEAPPKGEQAPQTPDEPDNIFVDRPKQTLDELENQEKFPWDED